MKRTADDASGWASFDGTFEVTRRRQVLAGLELDHTGRLRWLEARMSELVRISGNAAAPDDPTFSDTSKTPAS
jgi:hypothetical protein